MKGFKKARIYVEGKGIVKCDIGFEDGRIAFIGENGDIEEISKLPDDATIVPGFIDEHIHGAAGSDAMDGTVGDLANIADALASEGTVGFLATTMTQSRERILKAMNAVKDYRSQLHPEGAELLGVHLEGPFISVKHVGAQPIEYVAKPDPELLGYFNEASGDSIRIVSMAPEVDGAEKLINYMTAHNIVTSIGHTDAGYKDVEKAVQCGATSITHTYNAQKSFHHREVGTVGSAFLFDELNCECICDLIHVSAPAIRLLFKNKTKNGVTLITDAMRAKAMPDGESELGGQLVIVKNGEARLVDGTLAGSVLRMNKAVENVVKYCGISFTDAIDCASINPAVKCGVSDRLGSIRVGKDASVTVLSQNFDVLMTLRKGNVIFCV